MIFFRSQRLEMKICQSELIKLDEKKRNILLSELNSKLLRVENGLRLRITHADRLNEIASYQNERLKLLCFVNDLTKLWLVSCGI